MSVVQFFSFISSWTRRVVLFAQGPRNLALGFSLKAQIYLFQASYLIKNFSFNFQMPNGRGAQVHITNSPNRMKGSGTHRKKKYFFERCNPCWNWENDWHASVLWGFLLFPFPWISREPCESAARLCVCVQGKAEGNARRKWSLTMSGARAMCREHDLSDSFTDPLPVFVPHFEMETGYPSNNKIISVAFEFLLITHRRIWNIKRKLCWKFIKFSSPKTNEYHIFPAVGTWLA